MVLTEKGFSQINEIIKTFFAYVKFYSLLFKFWILGWLKNKVLKKIFIRAYQKLVKFNLVMKINLHYQNKLVLMHPIWDFIL